MAIAMSIPGKMIEYLYRVPPKFITFWISEVFAVEEGSVLGGFCLLIGILIASLILITLYRLFTFQAETLFNPPFPPPVVINIMLILLYVLPLLILSSYLLYRILFLGKFSRRPRQLFGLKGLITEFWSLCFFILNFITGFLYYSILYSSNCTNKPTWTDKLG
jgi:hypothetical protein